MSWFYRNISTLLLGVALLVAAGGQTAAVFDLAEKDQGEGPLLAMIARMWREPISADWITGSQCTLVCYGPVYLWATMGAQAVSGVYDSLLPGRFVSLAATWATALLLAWNMRRGLSRFSRREGRCHANVRDRRENGTVPLDALAPALAAALLYVTAMPVPWWGHVHRVDALAVLFSVSGVLAAGPACRRPWLSAVLIVAGSLVKQTAAFSAVGVVAYFLIRKQYRTALLYSLTVVVLGIAAWGALLLATDRYFLIAAIQGNMNKMSAYQGFRAACHFFLNVYTAPAALGILGFWLAVDRRKAAKMFRSIYVVAFLTGAAICAVLSSKEGAGSYYFLEPTAMAALVVCRFGLCELRRRGEIHARLAMLLIVAIVLPPSVGMLRREAARAWNRPEAVPAVLRNLDTTSGCSVMADGECVDLALAAGLKLQVNDPFLYRLLVENGSMSVEPLLAAMDRGEVRYLLLVKKPEDYEKAGKAQKAEKRWPEAVLDRMKHLYQWEGKSGNILVFRRR